MIPDIKMLNKRRRRKDRLRFLFSLACKLGIHDWVTREEIRGTTSVWGLFRGTQTGVPVRGLKQSCKHCIAQREVVDAGFHAETVPLGTL